MKADDLKSPRYNRLVWNLCCLLSHVPKAEVFLFLKRGRSLGIMFSNHEKCSRKIFQSMQIEKQNRTSREFQKHLSLNVVCGLRVWNVSVLAFDCFRINLQKNVMCLACICQVLHHLFCWRASKF